MAVHDAEMVSTVVVGAGERNVVQQALMGSAVGTAPRTPRPGGPQPCLGGPASVAILLLFYFFHFENYKLYFHDQMPRAAGWNRGGHQLNHPRHFVLYQGLL